MVVCSLGLKSCPRSGLGAGGITTGCKASSCLMVLDHEDESWRLAVFTCIVDSRMVECHACKTSGMAIKGSV
eukprot:284603-Amphidinium_carterae.1